jgi:hypothetical protein
MSCSFAGSESARIVYIREAGIVYSQGGTGIGPIMATINCHYRRPVNYPDTVHVGASGELGSATVGGSNSGGGVHGLGRGRCILSAGRSGDDTARAMRVLTPGR